MTPRPNTNKPPTRDQQSDACRIRRHNQQPTCAARLELQAAETTELDHLSRRDAIEALASLISEVLKRHSAADSSQSPSKFNMF
jgi:hypothetical protein